MAMDASEIEKLIKTALPDATVEIRDLAGDPQRRGRLAAAGYDRVLSTFASDPGLDRIAATLRAELARKAA